MPSTRSATLKIATGIVQDPRRQQLPATSIEHNGETSKEEARHAEREDQYSWESLFGGDVTPIDSPISIDIPLPSEFDYAFGVEGEFLRLHALNAGLPYDESSVKPPRFQSGVASRWKRGLGDRLQKSEEWEVAPVETRRPIDVYEHQMAILEKDRMEAEALMAAWADHSDDDDDVEMASDDGCATNTDGVGHGTKPQPSQKTRQLGPDATFICDPDEEQEKFNQHKREAVSGAVYPEEWVRKRSRKLQSYPTEIIE